MDFHPQTEAGKRLFTVMANWMEKSAEVAVDQLKRAFLMCSLKMKNEDVFITVLYGQRVLNESPSVLSQRFPSTLLRVQHTMEISLNKACTKELVVALERSENQSVLTEALSWTENNSKETQESLRGSPSVDLAPAKVQKRKLLSEIRTGSVTTRHREISWKGEGKKWEVLEVCNNKIIIGWDNGQIKIYNSADLVCHMVLNYCWNKARVACLQCTCTEIIAGYDNGKICLWNIQRGTLVQSFTVEDETGRSSYARRVRWKAPKLVVATLNRIHIWQYANSSFTLLGIWSSKDDGLIRSVEFNEDYVIVESFFSSFDVHHFNGKHVHSIANPAGILHTAFRKNHLIISDRHGTLQIWDISTGECVQELKGHTIYVFGLDAHNGVIASGNRDGKVNIWNVETALLEASQADLARFQRYKTKCVPFDEPSVNKIACYVVIIMFCCRKRRIKHKTYWKYSFFMILKSLDLIYERQKQPDEKLKRGC